MVEMDELVILATDGEPVRRYLRRMGIAEHDITEYVEQAAGVAARAERLNPAAGAGMGQYLSRQRPGAIASAQEQHRAPGRAAAADAAGGTGSSRSPGCSATPAATSD
jgi:hypothetical protein